MRRPGMSQMTASRVETDAVTGSQLALCRSVQAQRDVLSDEGSRR